MANLTISEVARQIGVRASAIRYYEQIGILPAAQRVSRRRRYDSTILERLAVVQRARQAGFSLDEIRQLFFGFRDGTAPSQRWKKLAARKLVELDLLTQQIKTMQKLLRTTCSCRALDECGRKILAQDCGKVAAGPLSPPRAVPGLSRKNIS